MAKNYFILQFSVCNTLCFSVNKLVLIFLIITQENVYLRHAILGAEWCRQTPLDGLVELPYILSMSEHEQKEMMANLGEHKEDFEEEESFFQNFTFVFEKKKDYDSFCKELMDQKNLKLCARFEDAS